MGLKRKNRIRWRKFKCRLKNFFLKAITVFAILMFIGATEVLIEQTLKGLLMFLVSLAWIVLFGHANGWFIECP